MRFEDKLVDRRIFGERVRQARIKKGFSQEQLAALTNRDQRAVSEIEAGQRKLAVTDLPAFAVALEVPLLYFFEGEFSEGDLELAMLKEFRRIPSEDGKKTAIKIVHILSQSPSLPPESD